MSESSAELSGGSKRYSSSSHRRKDTPRALDDFSSEEKASPGKSNGSVKNPPGSDAPKLMSKDNSNNVYAHSNFFSAPSHINTGVGSGAKGGQVSSKTQLSATSIESASSPESDRRSPGFSNKKRQETDNDNDIRSPLIAKDTGENPSARNAGKNSGSVERKQTLKARTKATATTTTTTNTTTTTTTTTVTTVPVYKASSSSSDEEVESSLSQERKLTSTADIKAKRLSYIASSVQPAQQSIAAVKSAESISGLPSGKQKETFEKTLGMIGQMNPESRCAALVKLAPALALFDSKVQAVYLPQLRKLASPPMSVQDRKKVVDALVCAYAGSAIVDGTDSDQHNLDGEGSDMEQAYPVDDAKALREFQQQIKDAKSKIRDVNAPGKQRSTDTIQLVLQDIAKSEDVCLKLEYAIGFLAALDKYHDADKKVIVSQLLKAFGDEIVTTALLLGLLNTELGNAAEIKISPSAMLAGFIEGDKNVVKILQEFTATAARTKPFLNAFYQRLLERSREMSTPGKNNARVAAATVYLLMDMAALSQLPEDSRCLLMMYLYFMNPKNLYQAISRTKKQNGETGFDFAHRVIAPVIDMSACSRLLPESATDKMEHLASYQDRVDAANGQKKQPRLQPGAKHLRALLLDSKGDAAGVKEAVRKVLTSSDSFEDKRVQLQALETAPLTDELPAYVEKFYFEKADAYLNELNPYKTRHLPDMDRLRTEKKPYYKTLSRIHEKLPPEKVKKLRKETKDAYDNALNSTLPAMHAAIMNNNVAMVKAYLDAVLEAASKLSSNETMELIRMPHKGKSAFYRALMRGTPDMIRTFIETILASKLDETHKVDLLLARRESDNFGAFYIAMSSRNPERVKAFMEAVLASKNLLGKNKEKLLKCKKELGKGAVANQNKASEIWTNAKLYARSEAVRNEEIWASREQKITTYDKISYGARKIPNKVNPKIKRDPAGLRNREEMPSLVALFDDLIDKSSLQSSTKDQLKDKNASRQ